MARKLNIVVGGMLQESNTFSSCKSGISDFYNYYFRTGEQLFDNNVDNELSGFLRAAKERSDVAILPTLFTQACSSGPIKRSDLDKLKQLLIEQLDGLPACDGVLFALHGSWVAEDSDDADGEIVTLIRNQVGADVPIVITLDSHANVTQTIMDQADALVAYRTFPHADYADTGYRAANMLFSMMDKSIKPHMHHVKIPLILPAEAHTTSVDPMKTLWLEADRGRRSGASLETSLLIVQPWLDVAELGCTVVVVGRDAAEAEKEAKRLAALLWSRRQQFQVKLWHVEQIIEAMRKQKPAGPVIVSDSADSPGAGSPGDSNAVLRQLLQFGDELKFTCLLSMVDGHAARLAADKGAGQSVTLSVGHSRSIEYGQPVEIQGTVEYVSSEGSFTFGSGTVSNMKAFMGHCAVIRIGSIHLLLMEHPTFTGDPAMYRSVGLEPLEADIVLVKSASQFRAEYERIANGGIYIVDTPGASTANLLELAFKKAPRPLFPLDECLDYIV
ncbi:M81 family metallopeptidase [Paenibacillus agaridevorans]|uniref:M81 family metallopeptidase n=1 Tax=Paenibacillus agaridevorans TaxID=171404 RepID=UPI001BE468DE|nr:M81 family metallopeptidase [Paenibacillus agaridevorans]